MRAVEIRRFQPAGVTGALFVTPAGTLETLVARKPDGTCVFFEADAGRLCAVHREAGEEALPSACRHFPREILVDRRGTLVSLSHFCPTAAALLLVPDALDVVEAVPPLRIDGPIEGLDATDVMAPLVRPGLLSDLKGYDAWERACLATLARADLPAERALDLITAATEEVREWRPGEGALAAKVAEAFRAAALADSLSSRGPQAPRHTVDVPFRASGRFPELCARHFPSGAGPVEGFDQAWDWFVEPHLSRIDWPMRNYLASRLFANWIAYQGRGLRTIVEWLRTCLAVLKNEIGRRVVGSNRPVTADDALEAARAADLLLLHTVDSEVIARHFASVEGLEPA